MIIGSGVTRSTFLSCDPVADAVEIRRLVSRGAVSKMRMVIVATTPVPLEPLVDDVLGVMSI